MRTGLLPQKPPFEDAYCEIVPFETGRMVTPAATLVRDALGGSMATSWRFLLRHARTNTHFWFDMGISHDTTTYPPSIQRTLAHFKPIPSKTSIEQDTISQNVTPESIKHVIVSHAHWDHVHPLPSSFTNATMLVGPGSTEHCKSSYPSTPESKFDGRIWDPSMREFPLTELPSTSTSTWRPMGPFPSTYDLFQDQSFILINAPGHTVGNLAALVRVLTKNNEWKWVILGGDCAHCNLFTHWPEAPFGRMDRKLFPSGTLHEDDELARETIRRIAEAKRDAGKGVFVWWAHGEFLEGSWEL